MVQKFYRAPAREAIRA